MNSLHREKSREKSQSREMGSLDNKYLEGKTLRDPSQDRYNDQRSGKNYCDERLKNPEYTGYFHGKVNLNADKVAGYYYNTHAKVTFENPPSNQALEDETSLLNQGIQNHSQVTP